MSFLLFRSSRTWVRRSASPFQAPFTMLRSFVFCFGLLQHVFVWRLAGKGQEGPSIHTRRANSLKSD